MTREELEKFLFELRNIADRCGSVADWLYGVQERTKKGKLVEISALTDEDLWYDDRLKVLDSLNVIEAEAGYVLDNIKGCVEEIVE